MGRSTIAIVSIAALGCATLKTPRETVAGSEDRGSDALLDLRLSNGRHEAPAFALAFLAFTWAGLFLVRPLVRPWVIPRSGPTTWSASRSQASVLYGLLFGLFAVVAAYQNYSTVYGNVDNEVASIAAPFRDLSGYPQPLRGKPEGDLRNYTTKVIEKSWPTRGRQRGAGFLSACLLFLHEAEAELDRSDRTSPKSLFAPTEEFIAADDFFSAMNKRCPPCRAQAHAR